MDSNTRLNNLLARIAEEQNYKNCDIKVTPISTGGANYSSLLYTAKISSQGKEDLHLFIKVLAIGEKIKEQIKSEESVIDREKAFYLDIKQAYDKIENKYDIPMKHRLWLPKCYGSEVSPLLEALVMENLVVKGFESFDRFKYADWEYASKAATELAKLHALSYAIQVNEPEEFKRICDKNVCDVMTETIINQMWASGVKNAMSVLHGDDKRKFEKFADEFSFKKFTEYRKPLQLTVIGHGDFRPSNFMHRVLEDNTVEVVILDHQTFYLGSPIPDLLNLIATATDKTFRDQYYHKLIEHYYTQLSDAFRRMNIDPEKTYSREDFYAEVKEDNTVEVVILDHQTFYLGSPIPDLLNLIATATDKTFRDQYYHKLIEHYYTQLSDAFRRMNIDPEKTYSREDFYAEVKEKLPYGLVAATFVLPFITVESDKAPELTTDMSIDSMQVTHLGPLYAERMRDMFSDFDKWGALDN